MYRAERGLKPTVFEGHAEGSLVEAVISFVVEKVLSKGFADRRDGFTLDVHPYSSD